VVVFLLLQAEIGLRIQNKDYRSGAFENAPEIAEISAPSRKGSRAVLAGSPSPLMGSAHHHVDPAASALAWCSAISGGSGSP
jgi:hypothetical protein